MLARVLLLAVSSLVLFGNCVQAAEETGAALQKVIENTAEKYEQAFKARDADSLVKLFTPEAEYVDSSGIVFHGRELIQAEFVANFAMTPPGELEIEILSIRPVAKGIVIEEGVSTFRSTENGAASQVHYTATHVEQPDGTWLMASVRELEDPQITPHDRLAELSWLEGEWQEEAAGSRTETKWSWSEDGNFLISEFSVQEGNEISLKGTQRIGWDAERQQFRSWIFDSTGGSVDGWWTAGENGTWSVSLSGIDASGARIISVLSYFPDGADGLVITREHQSRAGVELPSRVHRVVRHPPAPGQKNAH